MRFPLAFFAFLAALTIQTAQANLPADIARDSYASMISATGPWNTGAFNYDPTGNITRKQLGARIVTLNYSSLNNRLISVNDGGDISGYDYDNRGNVINNGRDDFTYDRSEQPVIVVGKGSFLYDGNKRRVRQSLNGEIIYTFYSFTGELLHRHNVTDNKRTDYLDVGGASLRISNAIATYTHKDHLGSPVAATNTSGATLWRELYSPYGEKQIDPTANRDNEGFTGHIDDTATGLTYMQARYYDPVIGRFLSNDPVGFADTLDPLMFNRFAYANNNPANLTDPTGMCPRCVISAGKIIKRTFKAKGNVFKAIRDEAASIADAGSTLLDPSASGLEKAGAVFEVLVGVKAPGVGKNALKNKPDVKTRTTRGGDPAVRITESDGSFKDISPKRVKEGTPNTHPKAPEGTIQGTKFDNAQPGSKGLKRDPTPQELDQLKDLTKDG